MVDNKQKEIGESLNAKIGSLVNKQAERKIQRQESNQILDFSCYICANPNHHKTSFDRTEKVLVKEAEVTELHIEARLLDFSQVSLNRLAFSVL